MKVNVKFLNNKSGLKSRTTKDKAEPDKKSG